MKTTLAVSLLVLVLFVPVTLLAQKEAANLIRNGDFEKFTGDNPDGWDTSNIPGTLTVVSASAVSKSGAKAVRCEVKDFYGSIIAGFVCQKNIPTEGKDLKLSASMMVHAVGSDQAVIVLCYLNSSGSTIGTIEEYVEDTRSKWTDIVKEYKSPPGSAMVHVRITVLADKASEKVHPGSYLICDNLRLNTVTPVAPVEKPLIQ
ncbi:MAG TPA: hypothetical protein VMH23_15795 [Bacteroidota bacterium]|nr:hypothetical protein [Bacteroidota bacterium]